MINIHKHLSMIVFTIIITLAKTYFVSKMYSDMSGWTLLPGLQYAQIVCIVFMLYAVKALLMDNILALQAYEVISTQKRIAKALAELMTIIIFYCVYFSARRFFG